MLVFTNKKNGGQMYSMLNLKKTVTAFMALLFFFIFANNLNADLSDYNFSAVNGSYQEITGGIQFILTNSGNYADDQRFLDPTALHGSSTTYTGVGLPIGFNFTFNQTVFDVVGINNNGWISFGQSALGASAVNMSSSDVYLVLASTTSITPNQLINRVAALNRDLKAQSSSSLSIETIGDSPNRVCVIQWKNYKRYGETGTGDLLNFQIRLYETTNNIAISYGDCTCGSNTDSDNIAYQVGLRGPLTTDFHVRTTTNNWANTTQATSNSATCILNQNVFPANGLSFLWSTSSSNTIPDPANLVFPANNAQNISCLPTLQWSAGNIIPSGYKLSVGTDNPPTNLLNNLDLNNTTQYTLLDSLNYLSNYYWKITPYNSFGQAQNCPVWSFSTHDNVITPSFSINTESLNFGIAYPDIPDTISVIITNTGQGTLNVNWTLPDHFTIFPASPTVCNSGQSVIVKVILTPTINMLGNYTGNIALTTNDLAHQTVNLPVTANIQSQLPEGYVQIGNGSLVNKSLPIEPYYKYSYTQSLYLDSELPDINGKFIQKIGYQFNHAYSYIDSVKIYMGYTDLDYFAQGCSFVPIDSLNLVYRGILNNSTGNDNWTITDLDSSFTFIPGRNLIIAVFEFTGSLSHGTNDDFFCDSTDMHRSLEFHTDLSIPNPLNPPEPTRSTSIPNTRIFIGDGFLPPTNLTATPGSRLVNLSWTTPQQNRMVLTNYKLFRNNTFIASINANTTTYTDNNLVIGTPYSYYITAVYSNPAGESIPSNTANATPFGSVLNPPVNLTASYGLNAIDLHWSLGQLDMYENFNSNTLPQNWSLLDNDADGNNWSISNINPHSIPYCMESISGNLNPDNWLVTPTITLGNHPVLSWWVAGNNDDEQDDLYAVYIATPSSPNFTIQLLQEMTSSGNWTRKSFNLNSFVDQSVKLAFAHRYSTGGHKVKLDDIAISSLANTAPDPDLIGFKIFRDNEVIAQIDANVNSYTDNNGCDGYHLYYITAIYTNGESVASNFVYTSTSEDNGTLPKSTTLFANYPNPFNPSTTIAFDLAKDQNVCLEIYNLKGQKVKTLVNEYKKAGTYHLLWNGKNDSNTNVGSGIYFYRIKSGNYTSTGKMILMK